MKKSIFLFTVTSAAALLIASCSGKPKTQTTDRQPDFNAAETVIGDTIVDTDSTVVATCYLLSGDGTTARTILLRTSKATSKTDTTLIDGFYSRLEACGSSLHVINGVDTASYPFATLPQVIKPIDQMRLPGSLLVESNHSFAVSDEAPKCEFSASIYVRRHPKLDVTQFLNNSLQQSFDQMFDSGAVARVAPEMDVKQASDFLAQQFEKAYRQEYKAETVTPIYTYDAFYYPDWQSPDEKLVTYMLYNDLYYGGAHGTSNGTYVTFDSSTGKALGIEDIFTPAGFDSAEKILAEQVAKYTGGTITTAYLQGEGHESNGYYVTYKDKTYPRPALTPAGVAFAYQPYDIAPFSEGIRYFLIPYDALKGALKPVK